MNVLISVVFSKNNKIGSKLISWSGNHVCPNLDSPSHAAIVVNDRWVIESTITSGVRVISYKKWLNINTEVYKYNYSDVYDYSHIKKMYKQIQNKKYDWFGVLYLGIYLLLNKFFKINIPILNKWQNPSRYFCLEVISKLNNQDYGMYAPIMVLKDYYGKNSR